MSFKIVTWNINSVRMRFKHLLELIDIHNPDIICLQELKCETEKFPHEEFSTSPYNIYVCGQKSYNGVAILSKIPADEVKTTFPNNPASEQARFIEISLNTPIGFSRIISLYVPNGGEVDSDNFRMKLDFYDNLTKYLDSIKSFEEKTFIGSDFNVAPFDIDVYDPIRLKNSICFTLHEQKKLRTILNSGFHDNYRIKNANKHEYSWWDYRAGAFEQNKGMRIDSIFSTSNSLQHLSDCFIDYQMRAKEKPSDHAPVIAIYE